MKTLIVFLGDLEGNWSNLVMFFVSLCGLCEVIDHFNQSSLYRKCCSSDYYALWEAAHSCVLENSCSGKCS